MSVADAVVPFRLTAIKAVVVVVTLVVLTGNVIVFTPDGMMTEDGSSTAVDPVTRGTVTSIFDGMSLIVTVTLVG